MDDSLNFKSHVTDICNRASRQMNSFKRFAKYLKIDRRLSVYKSFIPSNYSYCPLAWIFCGRKNSNKLEKLQERALRIVLDDFSTSYEILCERANTLPLSFYCIRFLGIEITHVEIGHFSQFYATTKLWKCSVPKRGQDWRNYIICRPSGRSMTAATALMDAPFSRQKYTNSNTKDCITYCLDIL